MRVAKVYRNEQLAGTLIQYNPKNYEFRYDDTWFTNDNLPAISLTLPKTQQTYRADHLFPFFFNMLSEGVNKKLQCRQLKIDENDYFGLLVATAATDTIGAVTIEREKK
ncbi:MAG: HipA N-terminal domain-containing protein [Candidatus Marinimicrobia bacterium]|nr:HipA N-terminal domain-containing protein [Candidatus Neomarinimicrobiota bacterium]MBL7011210.1 HipA N-terminal domain-containing protein [Candidatus Neomarinimicrobiota bacterium]MBL7030286.1 HipA N-terminal domain-containing protein [Candidatus Neomarinimicrobiota bacterium]